MYTFLMFRTQIYLPEELHQLVKLKADQKNESMAEFLRRCIERGMLVEEEKEQKKRAAFWTLSELNVTGGPKDLSKKIDHYLYGQEQSTKTDPSGC